jgi:hypothetical protein
VKIAVDQDNSERRIKMGWIDRLFGRKKPVQPTAPKQSTGESTAKNVDSELNPLQLARLLAGADRQAAKNAAKAVWANNDWILELTINILASKGAAPSGIPHEAGRRGAELLRDTCPPSRKEVFQRLALEAFGPATAGIASQSSQTQQVILKEKKSERMRAGNIENIEVYNAKTKMDALRFLEGRQVVGMFSSIGVHRIIVQTPQGAWGKDASGIYDVDE